MGKSGELFVERKYGLVTRRHWSSLRNSLQEEAATTFDVLKTIIKENVQQWIDITWMESGKTGWIAAVSGATFICAIVILG